MLLFNFRGFYMKTSKAFYPRRSYEAMEVDDIEAKDDFSPNDDDGFSLDVDHPIAEGQLYPV